MKARFDRETNGLGGLGARGEFLASGSGGLGSAGCRYD